jgi:hypothetical protein
MTTPANHEGYYTDTLKRPVLELQMKPETGEELVESVTRENRRVPWPLVVVGVIAMPFFVLGTIGVGGSLAVYLLRTHFHRMVSYPYTVVEIAFLLVVGIGLIGFSYFVQGRLSILRTPVFPGDDPDGRYDSAVLYRDRPRWRTMAYTLKLGTLLHQVSETI